jgi:hypothetical protein
MLYVGDGNSSLPDVPTPTQDLMNDLLSVLNCSELMFFQEYSSWGLIPRYSTAGCPFPSGNG